MRRLTLGLLLALAALAPVAGCGGSGSSGGGMGDHTDITGSWDVTFTVTGGDLPAGQQYKGTLMLVQTGMDVTGSSPLPGGSTANLEGMVVGQTFTFTITEDPPCAGTATGEGTIDAAFNRIDGTLSGTDCKGTLEADFVATRR